MGGKMNLNPLKKDDNTDALVKALEDANNVGTVSAATPGMQPATDNVSIEPTVTDDVAIAADPQILGDSVVVDAPVTSDTGITSQTDSDTPLVLDDSELPVGISSDADAHLSTSGEGTGDNGELDGVKKDALEQLRPLIEKLDLEPADKFDKYLMMLRASDDPALIKPAFDAAQAISGEKEKAQALLDIINEINYITAQK